MTRWLKQSTSVDLPIGPFIDSTDGVTAKTALSITQPDIRLKKNAANWGQKAAAQTLAHEENGWYEVTLDTTDTNTLGCLELAVVKSGALQVWHEFMVVPANIWDSLYGADILDVSVTQWLGNGVGAGTAGVPNVDITRVNNVAAGTTAAQLGVNVVSYASGQAPLQPTVAGRTLDVTTTGEAGVDWANVGTPGSTVALSATTVGTVSAVTGLTASNLDTTVSSRLAPTVAGRTLDVSTGGEAGVDWANVGTPGSIVALSATTVGTVTTTGTATNVTTVNGLAANVITAASINTGAITNAKFAAGAIDAAAIATDAIGAAELAADAATEIANAVWSLDATGQQTQGTFGQAIGDPAATAKSIWSVANALPDSGALTTLQADTDDIQTRLPAALVSGRMDASVGAMATNTMTASALATDAVTEIVNAIIAVAGADPSGVPAVNAAWPAKIDWICAKLRNKETMNRTTGVVNLRNDGDTTTIGTFTAADDGTTFTRPKAT